MRMKLNGERGMFSVQFKKKFLFVPFLLKCFLLFLSLILFGSLEKSDVKSGIAAWYKYSSNFSRTLKEDITPNNNDVSESSRYLQKLLIRFYSDRNYSAAWTINYNVNEQFLQLFEIIKSTNQYGLIASDYSIDHLDSLRMLMNIRNDKDQRTQLRVEFEKTATESAFRLLINLSIGLNPCDSLLELNDYQNELPVYLNYIVQNNSLKQGVLALQPHSRQYQLLRRALEAYLQKVPIDTIHYSVQELKQNDTLLNHLLAKRDYLDKMSGSTENALKKIQIAYNLKATGFMDEATLQKLTLSTKDIFNIMALNLDRLRKDNLTDESCINVNIPEFKLYYYDYHGQILTCNVVVGKFLTPTPMISSAIDKIIFNPCWNVPRSIVLNEILPKIQTDSMYLSKHEYSIMDGNSHPVDVSKIDWNHIDNRQFDYYLRQQNSESNALGSLKFMFPNPYSVYLHDTPSKNQFNDKSRAYSHGCIRVQYPEKLAQQIVRIECAAMSGSVDVNTILRKKETYELRLPEPVKINISYYTCKSDSTGEIYFFPDVYKYDSKEIDRLFTRNSSAI